MITEKATCSVSDLIKFKAIRLILALCVYLFLIIEQSSAQTVPLELDAASGPGDMNAHVEYLIEDEATLTVTEIAASERQYMFQPINAPEPDFGYISGAIWLRVPIINTTTSEQDRILILETNFMSEIAVHFVSDKGIRLLLDQDQSSHFSTRPIPYHELAAPVTFAPNEAGALYIRYRSNGDTVLPLSLETPLEFATNSSAQIVVDFVFYGVMAMMIIASLVGRLFFRNSTFLTYALYVGGVLMLIFQRDGYAFQYLWPNAPAWNDFSALPLGATLPVFAAIFTRSYLNTKDLHPQIDRILIGVGVANIAVIGSAFIVGAALAKQIALLLVTLSILVFVCIGVFAFRKYGRRSLFFVIGWSGLLLAAMIMTTVHLFGINIPRAMSLDIMRASMVFDAFMMGLASVFRIVDMQRDRERLNHERIAVLDANVKMHGRLSRLEEKYRLAQQLAETNSQLLVDTTHDLRQPLFALRNTILGISSGEKPSADPNEIERSFDYIEKLVETVLESAIDQDESGRAQDETEIETITVQSVFDALETMFRGDAASTGTELNFVPTRASVTARSFVVLRIMSNFVSNAIRYSEGGRVLVGLRRKGDHVSLEVHDDGPGMSAPELQEVKSRFSRGGASANQDGGIGVGLSIVNGLAVEHGLEWTIESRESFGTSTYLRLQRCHSSNA